MYPSPIGPLEQLRAAFPGRELENRDAAGSPEKAEKNLREKFREFAPEIHRDTGRIIPENLRVTYLLTTTTMAGSLRGTTSRASRFSTMPHA
jgi:hypothetical protein